MKGMAGIKGLSAALRHLSTPPSSSSANSITSIASSSGGNATGTGTGHGAETQHSSNRSRRGISLDSASESQSQSQYSATVDSLNTLSSAAPTLTKRERQLLSRVTVLEDQLRSQQQQSAQKLPHSAAFINNGGSGEYGTDTGPALSEGHGHDDAMQRLSVQKGVMDTLLSELDQLVRKEKTRARSTIQVAAAAVAAAKSHSRRCSVDAGVLGGEWGGVGVGGLSGEEEEVNSVSKTAFASCIVELETSIKRTNKRLSLSGRKAALETVEVEEEEEESSVGVGRDLGGDFSHALVVSSSWKESEMEREREDSTPTFTSWSDDNSTGDNNSVRRSGKVGEVRLRGERTKTRKKDYIPPPRPVTPLNTLSDILHIDNDSIGDAMGVEDTSTHK